MKKRMGDQFLLQVEEVEQWIAPDVSGTDEHDGQPGNQVSASGNLSDNVNQDGSANPENSESGPNSGKDNEPL